MPTSRRPHQAENLLDEFVPLLRVALASLMTEGIEKAHIELKDSQGNAIDGTSKRCRAAMAEAILAVLGTVPAELRKDHANMVEHLQRLAAELAEVKKELHQVKDALSSSDVLRVLQPHAEFLDRLKRQLPDEKRAIARHVVKKYFQKSGVRCFVQASTLAIVLGHEIARRGEEDILVHTNSAAFPLTVLRQGSGQFVYTACGGEYDAVCAGWLFSRRDMKARDEIVELFQRSKDPLDTAFVMPLLLTTDGSMYFQREETAFLVELLAAHAKYFAVLGVADRISDTTDPDSPISLSRCPTTLSEAAGAVSIITSGATKRLEPSHIRHAFHQQGFDVDWVEPVPDGQGG